MLPQGAPAASDKELSVSFHLGCSGFQLQRTSVRILDKEHVSIAGAVLIWEKSSSGGLLVPVWFKAAVAVTVIGLLELCRAAFFCTLENENS